MHVLFKLSHGIDHYNSINKLNLNKKLSNITIFIIFRRSIIGSTNFQWADDSKIRRVSYKSINK